MVPAVFMLGMDSQLAETLRTGDAFAKLDAIRAAAEAGAAAAHCVPALAALLSSDDYVHDIRVAHSLLCEQAAYAIREIGIAPDIDTLRALLKSDRVMEFPVACFDQGVYVGDYASQEVATAGLAAQLIPMMGVRGLRLLPDLLANASSHVNAIADPADAAIAALLARVSDDDRAQGVGLRSAIEAERAGGPDASPALRALIEVCIDGLDNLIVQDNRPPAG